MKRSSLAGTHLSLDPRRGIYVWRRVDPTTGRRVVRSTGMRRLDLAMRAAAAFEEAWDRRRVGLKSVDNWRVELRPLVEGWIESLGDVRPLTRNHNRMALLRALDELGLVRAADLDDVAGIHDRLLRLGKRKELPMTTLRRCYQDVLRRFSRYLSGNRRFLDRDPLGNWEPITAPKGRSRPRRAFLPQEVARALLAADVLDGLKHRRWPARPAFLSLLVVAPREAALVDLDVQALQVGRSRLDLGADVGTKRKGAGALDPATLADLMDYVAGRDEGPLFLSFRGQRWGKLRLLGAWREAFGLGVVDALWPADAPQEVELAAQVAATLAAGRVQVDRGGNPRLIRPDTIARRKAREEVVVALADRLREPWTEAMTGVDVHSFRRTHRTWALAAGVLPPAVDKQLGHASTDAPESFAILKVAAGSRTGRRHYLDVGSSLFDAEGSAAAVRRLLDEALGSLEGSGSLLLPRATDGAKQSQAT